MGFRPHYLFALIVAVVTSGAIFVMARWALELRPRARAVSLGALALGFGFVWSYAALSVVRIARHFPGPVIGWVMCIGIFFSAFGIYLFLVLLAVRKVPAPNPSRRTVLKAAAGAALAAPASLASFAIIHRNDLHFREVDLRIPSLPPDLDGLRIAQLTDIHLSNFVPEELLVRAIGMANDVNPHISLVTGDLITAKGDPLDTCLKRLKELRADAGVFGCMGNHEKYSGAESYVESTAARSGIRFLRSDAQLLRFGNAALNLAGVDHQTKSRPPYLKNAETLVAPGTLNVLLCHNPDAFPAAVEKGFDLTIAGHTHGGQVNFEMVHPALNVVRFTTPYVYGVYQHEGRQMYVSRGIGTIGVPARLGAPPEVVCIRLCAT
jgi:predicted MPP superfamily phosphohydrolase